MWCVYLRLIVTYPLPNKHSYDGVCLRKLPGEFQPDLRRLPQAPLKAYTVGNFTRLPL